MVKISVIIPVYNTSEYLRMCLDSIISQTYADIEIICIDDGSTDDSLSILKEYGKKDDRFNVISQQNSGLSEARNVGLQHSSGDYVIFVDSDDYLETDAIECYVSNIGDCDLIVSGIHTFGDTSIKRKIGDRNYFRVHGGQYVLDDSIRLNTYVTAWGKMYRKKSIDTFGIRFPKGLLFEDYSFFWQYISVSKRISFVERKVYHYRYRPNSILSNTIEHQINAFQHLDVFDHFMSTPVSNNISIEIKNAIFMQSFSYAYENTYVDNRKQLIEKSRNLVNRYRLNDNRVGEILCSAMDYDDAIHRIEVYMDPLKCIKNPNEMKYQIKEYGLSKFIKRFIWCIFDRLLR